MFGNIAKGFLISLGLFIGLSFLIFILNAFSGIAICGVNEINKKLSLIIGFFEIEMPFTLMGIRMLLLTIVLKFIYIGYLLFRDFFTRSG